MSLNKSPIEWTDYTWNPVTGCWGPGGSRKRPKWCPACYARKIATRFRGREAFPNGFEPTFHPDRLAEPYRLKKPSMIFTVSMGDLFGSWLPDSWIAGVLAAVSNNERHIFQILTKNPENLYGWQKFFADNLWLGVSVSRQEDVNRIFHLRMQPVRTRFVSFEPLLGPVEADLRNIGWIIIGGQTRPMRIPKKEWVQPLIEQARAREIPIFLKDNFHWPEKIREFPEVK